MTNNQNRDEIPTKRTSGDVGHLIVEILAGFIHAGALLNYLITPPLEKRRNEWLDALGTRLVELEKEKGISLEDLKENDEFIDIVIQATQIALRSSQEEKKEALQNAILNNARGCGLILSKQQMFISYIDTFTVWHIKLLELFSNPVQLKKIADYLFPHGKPGELPLILEEAFTEMRGERDFYDQFWKDLYSRGLVNIEDLHINRTGSGLTMSRATSIGEDFITYITSK
ncbi:MAG: hypothetical protein BA867_05115 [Desulfobacterales bacterium S5133MH16]|nr:MAG: hypothetical protein BA867_05115 [Desulfobacterales bacterium S5133MH16]